MVGRSSELRHLLELATTPDTAVAFLAGEAGIGKTRLVHELINILPEGTTVLVGQAEPGTLARPFELLLSALDRPLAAERPGRAPQLDPAELDLLTDASRTQVERLRTGLQLVQQLTSGGPSVIVFEDLHWADSESIALFEHITDLEGDRLLIGTYRPADVVRRHPIAGLLDRLERRYSAYHVRLERLDLDETSAFIASAVGAPPPYRTAVALHHRTGGNPFFLEELLRAGHDLRDLGDQPLPWSLAEALRRQVDGLDSRLQRLVEAAAVLGYRIPFDLLAAVSGRDESSLIWDLRDLVAQGVLVETGEDEFAFRHALVQEAIAERLLGRERRRLHEAALEALLADEGEDGQAASQGEDQAGGGTAGQPASRTDWAAVAKHARGAGRYADMVTAARRGAAANLAIGSAFEALRLAEMGLDEVPEDPELLKSAANAAWLAGLHDDAEGYARRWQAGASSPSDQVDALCLRVRIAWATQDLDLMSALSGELAALVADLPETTSKAHAMAVLAQSARLRDLDDDAMDWAQRAVSLSDRVGAAGGVRLAALVEKGALLAARAATIEEGRALLMSVAEEAERAGEWLTAARALDKLIHLPPSMSWRELAGLLERMRTDAERAGSEQFAVAAYYQGQARLFMHKGNLARAMDAIERGRARELSYQRTKRPSDTHGVFLAGLLLEAGEIDRATQVTGDLAGVPGMDVAIPGLEFHIACRRGDLNRARSLISEVIATVQATGGRNGEFAHDLVSAALAAPLTTGEVAKLIDGIDGPSVDPAYRMLISGQYAEAIADYATALAQLRMAAEADGLPPAARGTAHVAAARCLITLNRHDEARSHVAAAGELLERWSGWRVAELEAVRSRLGLADAPEPEATGVAALTPREREVAALIAAGLTNAALAKRLYISPRTAAVHVSNILRKLGVSSRAEVGALLTADRPRS